MSLRESWQRRLSLLKLLMHRGHLQTADAAIYLEVDRKKALDDLKALEEHGVPLRPVPDDPRDVERAWVLAESWRHSGIDVTLFERLAILLGRELLAPMLGEGELGDALRSIDRELGSTARGVELDDEGLARRFHIVAEPRKRYADKGELVSRLAAAVAYSYRLDITYRRPDRAEPKLHARVRPLTLAIYRSGLYLYVMHADDDRRRWPLAVDRMDHVVELGETFDYPRRGVWDIERELAQRFGLMPTNEAAREVRLRFRKESRSYALEREWSPDQRVEELADGGVDLVFVAEGKELAYRVLEWGGHCEVVTPITLRDEVVALARAVIERHQ